ncbi:MAG: lipopolysaccharide biosynthesis [Confluentimicrobium sp.]|jgi:uncharacterized protein involved in exopolysaccharide biosynthesis|uniref:GumC family protein n=1 Tax=Actibacterium sp. TaxID=1872125 RepID=UPI0005103D76|nr:hypothetical protein [Actibacterium sp.]KGB83661.1 hypothetical protein JT55_00530 [Rhodovulum sp. NI22]MBC56977.1 lipopolysaccharide biosynthesis [Actibacterium sp.]MDY6860906.1 lipopolysaccharide biosynthesis [Pseudomonadota bacterium]
MNSDVKYFVALFVRRLPVFLIVFLGFAAAALSAAMLLPTVYSSGAKLLIESAQIPGNLATSTVQVAASEQLQIIQQRILTRAILIDVARAHDVYEHMDDMSPDEIVARMRNDTNIRGTSGRNAATIMNIQFQARSAAISANVVNDYVTRILDQNVRLRTGQAQDTLEFFKQEVDRLGAELDRRSAAILDFQNANADALPAGLPFRMSRQSTLQAQVDQFLRDKAALIEQRNRLIEIFETTGQLNTTTTANQSPEERQLVSLKDQLAAALAIYSEENPRVKVLQARIAQLEETVRAQSGVGAAANGTTMLDVQLAQIDARVDAIDAQIEQAEGELAVLEDAIGRTPANDIALQALQREHNNIQQQYNSAVQRLSAAATGERIELLSKGQRITVIEQAVAPTEPTSPNRPMIAIGGTAAGLAAGLGLVFLIELLNKSVRRPADIAKGLNITPLATIPFNRTGGELVRRRVIVLVILAVFLAGVPAALYAIHTYYLPLDLIMSRAVARLSL